LKAAAPFWGAVHGARKDAFKDSKKTCAFMSKGATSNKVIITCAITGGIHTPTMCDALPYTPDNIATQSIAAGEAGALFLHLHARDPKDGRQAGDRRRHQHHHRRRVGHDGAATARGAAGRQAGDVLVNMGSMNFAIFPLADRYKTWKHDWEEPYRPPRRRRSQGPPEPDEEYVIYQALVRSWPIEMLDSPHSEALSACANSSAPRAGTKIRYRCPKSRGRGDS
jgi:uncharacterized protein (DUF849 family)